MNNASLHSSSVNGQPGASVSVGDRGLAFGDGVFETLRVTRRAAPLWSYHRDRLQEGCRRLFIPLDLQQLEIWIDELLQQQEPGLNGVLKIIVTRGAGGRGYGIDPALTPTVVCSLHPLPSPAPGSQNLYLCQQRLAHNPMLAGIKHLNRLENILLKAECQQAGFDDGLVLDAEDDVIETVSSNVFFEKHGELYTADLRLCGVAGVMRRLIVEQLAPELGLRVNVMPIAAATLPDFSAGFTCNSVRGIVPIARITGVDARRSYLEFSASELIQQLMRHLQQKRMGW